MKHAAKIIADIRRLTVALQEQSKLDCCPACNRAFNLAAPKRFCSQCGKQITRYHKWQIGEDGRIRHRVCERPDSYH